MRPKQRWNQLLEVITVIKKLLTPLPVWTILIAVPAIISVMPLAKQLRIVSIVLSLSTAAFLFVVWVHE